MLAGMDIRNAHFAELDPLTLHDILKLRADVFIIEQRCLYPDIDGRDTEPATVHCWAERDGEIHAYVRLLTGEGNTAIIGRVVTSPEARSKGLGTTMVTYAIGLTDRPLVIHAQAHLERWYAALGFATHGDTFLEDGQPHVEMRRAAPTPSAADRLI